MAMSMPIASARNHFLDALRGIAALSVLVTHLQSSLVAFIQVVGLRLIRLQSLCWITGGSVWICSF